jgi:hypothetical protein
MEYRAKASLEWLTWLLLNCLIWTGFACVAWNLLKPGGWLYWILDLIVRNQPTSFYYLGVGVFGAIAGKFWLDSIGPHVFHHLLMAIGAFAGTCYILRLLLEL